MESIFRHLSNILDGIGLVFEAPNQNRKYKRAINGFHEDQRILRGDVQVIGNDICNKAKEAYVR